MRGMRTEEKMVVHSLWSGLASEVDRSVRWIEEKALARISRHGLRHWCARVLRRGVQ
jgi:hypothetical protein